MIWFVIAQLHAFSFGIVMPPPPPPPALFQQAAQEPKPVLPAHVRGPHEGEPNALCTRVPTFSRDGFTYYECHCDFICDMGAGGEPVQREADNCVTACGKDQCMCHMCESCDQPKEPRQ